MCHHQIISLAAILACAAAVLAEDPAGPADNDSHETLVYVFRNAPALDAAQALSELYQRDARMRVVPNAAGNVVLLRVAPELRTEVLKVLESLDRQPKTVSVELLLVRAQDDHTRSLLADRRLAGPEIMSQLKVLENAGQVHERVPLEAQVYQIRGPAW